MDFQPDARTLASLTANRAGKLTASQRASVTVMAFFSGGGLFFLLLMLAAMVGATFQGVGAGGFTGWFFLLCFLLTYLYLGGTLYVNARMFIPDALSSAPVKQARGKLEIRLPQRDRPELPFSYIVGDYSFAPFMVPAEIDLEKGRQYVVYYAAHSRLFLSIEPL